MSGHKQDIDKKNVNDRCNDINKIIQILGKKNFLKILHQNLNISSFFTSALVLSLHIQPLKTNFCFLSV